MARTTDNSAAYDLAMSEPAVRPQNPQRRQGQPQRPQQRPGQRPGQRQAPKTPKLVPNKPKPREQVIAELVAGAKRAVTIFILSAIVLTMFGILLQRRAESVKLDTQLAQLNAKVEVAESDRVSLEAKFNSLISIQKVEEYAQNELGMVKRQRYQKIELEPDGSDGVVLSKGKPAE